MSGNARIEPKRVEKSASQNSTAGSVSSAAAAAREKRKHAKGERGDRKSEPPQLTPATSSTTVIKAPGGKREPSETGVGRRAASGTGEKDKHEKVEKTEKGILKNKKSRSKSGADVRKPTIKSKGKPKPQKRTFTESLMRSMGFYVGEVVLNDPYAIEAAQALDLQQWHLRRLKARFDKIDLDGSGNIDYDEFFESIGEARSPFTDKLFALIDLDGSGTIEFDEYVRVMATYCMFTKDEILRFCFECFDVDKSGTIDEKEFVELCKCINNASPAFPSNFKKALEEFDVNEDGLIDYNEFCQIDQRYPLVLFPAFRLQDVMQRNSLGERAWLGVIENYQRSKQIEEYKAQHGGRLPPEPPLTMLAKLFFPCLFKQRVHIRVGLDMENRHRDG